MFNLKNPNNVHFGTGMIIANGEDVGLLQGDVTFSSDITYKAVQGGSPPTTFKNRVESESASITANSMELDLDILGKIVPQFTKSLVSAASQSVVGEFLSGVFFSRWQALQNRNLSPVGIAVELATKLTAPVTAGDDVIHVEDASVFGEGDTLRLRAGATTETLTVDTGGVDTVARTLTLTAGATNSYATTGVASNGSTTLTVNTDYRVDYLGGRLCAVDGGAITDGTGVAVSYSYEPIAGTKLSFGGKTTTFTFPMKFISDDADDGKHYEIDFYKAQFNGGLSLTFKPSDVCLVPISIIALADSSRTEGDQLFGLFKG